MKKKGILFIIVGPSGAGKTTLAKIMKESFNDKIIMAPTYTTRLKRENEIDLIDYNFVTNEEFKKLNENGFFLEVISFGNNLYGTPKEYLNKLENGNNLILIVDSSGLKKWKEIYDKVFSFFIDCEDEEILKRISKRSIEEMFEIEKRIKKNKEEREINKFSKISNVTILNSNLEKSKKIMSSFMANLIN